MSKILEDLHPGMYINQVGKDSKRYFTFKLTRCLLIRSTSKNKIWEAEKYVPDISYYESDCRLDTKFFTSSQVKYRKTRLCEIFNFEIHKIKDLQWNSYQPW